MIVRNWKKKIYKHSLKQKQTLQQIAHYVRAYGDLQKVPNFYALALDGPVNDSAYK